MKYFFSKIDYFLQLHNVDFVKDVLLTSLSLDKILTFIGLIYAIKSFRGAYRIGKVNFYFQLVESHRDIWSKIHELKLHRIRDTNIDANSVTDDEKRHIIFLVLHIRALFEGYKCRVYDFNFESQKDTGMFFNLPIPSKVWESIQAYYDKDFIEFMESARHKAKYNSEYEYNQSITRKLVFDKIVYSINAKFKNFGKLITNKYKNIIKLINRF